MAQAHATLDSPILRSRWRRDYPQPVYSRRPARQLRSEVFHDVSPRPKITAAQQIVTAQTESRKIPLAYMSRRQLVMSPEVFGGPAHTKVLARNLVRPPRVSVKQEKKQKHHSKLQVMLVVLSVTMFLGGLSIAYIGLKADRATQAQAAILTKQANQASKSTVQAAQSASALSTVKPSPATLASYVVAPNLPRYLIIPGLGVDARVLSVGVNSEGALLTPNNIYDTAWYNESSQPGQPGAMLIDGHISSWSAHGVFYGLKDLQPGDSLQIVRGDGTVFNYRVVQTQIYPSGNVDMSAAISPIVPGAPGLNLISCIGDVIPGTSQFNERIVVFTKQVN